MLKESESNEVAERKRISQQKFQKAIVEGDIEALKKSFSKSTMLGNISTFFGIVEPPLPFPDINGAVNTATGSKWHPLACALVRGFPGIVTLLLSQNELAISKDELEKAFDKIFNANFIDPQQMEALSALFTHPNLSFERINCSIPVKKNDTRYLIEHILFNMNAWKLLQEYLEAICKAARENRARALNQKDMSCNADSKTHLTLLQRIARKIAEYDKEKNTSAMLALEPILLILARHVDVILKDCDSKIPLRYLLDAGYPLTEGLKTLMNATLQMSPASANPLFQFTLMPSTYHYANQLSLFIYPSAKEPALFDEVTARHLKDSFLTIFTEHVKTIMDSDQDLSLLLDKFDAPFLQALKIEEKNLLDYLIVHSQKQDQISLLNQDRVLQVLKSKKMFGHMKHSLNLWMQKPLENANDYLIVKHFIENGVMLFPEINFSLRESIATNLKKYFHWALKNHANTWHFKQIIQNMLSLHEGQPQDQSRELIKMLEELLKNPDFKDTVRALIDEAKKRKSKESLFVTVLKQEEIPFPLAWHLLASGIIADRDREMLAKLDHSLKALYAWAKKEHPQSININNIFSDQLGEEIWSTIKNALFPQTSNKEKSNHMVVDPIVVPEGPGSILPQPPISSTSTSLSLDSQHPSQDTSVNLIDLNSSLSPENIPLPASQASSYSQDENNEAQENVLPSSVETLTPEASSPIGDLHELGADRLSAVTQPNLPESPAEYAANTSEEEEEHLGVVLTEKDWLEPQDWQPFSDGEDSIEEYEVEGVLEAREARTSVDDELPWEKDTFEVDSTLVQLNLKKPVTPSSHLDSSVPGAAKSATPNTPTSSTGRLWGYLWQGAKSTPTPVAQKPAVPLMEEWAGLEDDESVDEKPERQLRAKMEF